MPTETHYLAAAWNDPATGHINVALSRVVVDGADTTTEIAEDWDCATRRPVYGETIHDAEHGPEPTRPAAALSVREATEIRDALDVAIDSHYSRPDVDPAEETP